MDSLRNWLLRSGASSFIAAAPVVVWAATPATHGVDILVDQVRPKGEVSIGHRADPASAESAGRLEGKPAIVLSPEDSAQLVVVKALPILFNYSAEITQTTPTENYAVTLQFLESIKALAPAPVSQARLAPPGCVVTYAGECLEGVLEAARNITDFKKLAQDSLVDAIRRDAGAVVKDKENLRSLVESLKNLLGKVEKLHSADYKARMLPIPDPSIGAWEVPGKVPATGSGSLEDLTDKYADQVRSIVKRVRTLVEGRRDLQDALKLASAFESDYKDALDDKPVGEPLAYDRAHDRVQTLKIAANEKFADLFTPEVLKYQSERTGNFDITYEPYERLSLTLGAGVIYSFVRDPEFTAEPTETSGQFNIVKKEDDYSALDGVVVLNVTGSKWRLFGVHPFVQIGVVPSSDNMAFLLGGGLQLFDRGALSMGAIYQRVDRLSANLHEGSTIANVDDLKTDKEFKAGFFVGLAITLE